MSIDYNIFPLQQAIYLRFNQVLQTIFIQLKTNTCSFSFEKTPNKLAKDALLKCY